MLLQNGDMAFQLFLCFLPSTGSVPSRGTFGADDSPMVRDHSYSQPGSLTASGFG